MLHAVFVRTLRPGVTYEEFRDAWMPERVGGHYPARTSIGRSVADDRQVLTMLELDMTVDDFADASGALTRPDAAERLDEIVASTQLEGVYEEVFGPATFP